MRLINAETLQLEDFSLLDIPPYAILSHTWGADEVSFRDMVSPDRVLKKGFAKITETCRLAREENLAYVWVDTACIDKSSSAELSEAINSMFQYYAKARTCYVYLIDLPPTSRLEDNLAKCRWLTRGWTLQELLAPEHVVFYDTTWQCRGSKADFAFVISNLAAIPTDALLGIGLLS